MTEADTAPMTARHHVVVARALSGTRIREGEQLQVPAQSAVGPAVITFRSRYADEGFESPIPRELWVDIRGEADCTLEEAINASWGTANGLVPSLAVATNDPLGLDWLSGTVPPDACCTERTWRLSHL